MNALDDPLAWLAARAGDGVSADPVRLRVLQGLAQRASAQTGDLRARLVGKLVSRAEAEPAVLPIRAIANATSPLTVLLAELQSAGPELRIVTAHHRTWGQLRVQRRMAEVSAPVPVHLGPLNSQVLVTRALQQLQDLSPGYLQRLLTQLDTLAALAPLQATAEAEARPARPAAKKTAPRRR
ncbi:MAG: DUF2894 domain-containing protein [Rubrivivax sp.]|nr:MAG: DUF2894 domain-containing protein [Rubrivivax sp.]